MGFELMQCVHTVWSNGLELVRKTRVLILKSGIVVGRMLEYR